MSVVESALDSERYRRELIGYCYRYLGSYAEAEDAVQETMLRAWQGAEGFAGRSSLRTWLYRIATNVCVDMSRSPQRRALPMDLSAPGDVGGGQPDLSTLPEHSWVGPLPDTQWSTDPAEIAAQRDTLRLAFIAALQRLPPRQRVVLILRDVLAWSAQECAELLESSVASVNSALARARSTMGPKDQSSVRYQVEGGLLREYMEAFEAYDVDRLVALLSEDATFSMPPYRLWLRGPFEIERWWRGPGTVCVNSKVLATRANTYPAVAVYHLVEAGRWEPFAIHVLEPHLADAGPRLSSITHFMDTAVFVQFGLPPHPP